MFALCQFHCLSFFPLTIGYKAASLADSTPASAVPLPLRVEPKPKSGIRYLFLLRNFISICEIVCSFELLNLKLCRQQDLLKKVVEIKPKKPRVTSPAPANEPTTSSNHLPSNSKTEADQGKEPHVSTNKKSEDETKVENPVKSLLGLAYASSDEED